MKVTTPRQLFVAAMMLAGILAGGVGTAAAQAPNPQAVNLRLFNSGLLDDGSPAPEGPRTRTSR